MEAWLEHYAPLRDIDEAGRRRLAGLKPFRVPGGTTLFAPGAACEGFVLVLSGRVRVGLTGESGREIVLYRVSPGETCVQTTFCLMGGDAYSADGVAETDVDAVMVPRGAFEALMAESAVFRGFIFRSFGARLARMMELLEAVAFTRVDARLARLLLSRVGDDGTVRATHQDLAAELGSAREVVSRTLERFADKGAVGLSRGCIALSSPAALREIAEG